MATGDLLKRTKAVVGGTIAAVAGLLLPGVTYLLTVDEDGLTGNEWRHALFLSIAGAAVSGVAVGAAVHRVENKPQDGVLLGRARRVGEPRPWDANDLDA